MSRFDTVVLGGHVVLSGQGPVRADLGIKGGRIAAIADNLAASDGDEVIDAKGLMVFPGAVDAHFHIGIYRPVDVDARSETESSLVGGVTTVLSYFRTGQHYLNRTGPYHEIIPEVLASTEGNAYTDYGYHIAPMGSDQVNEIDWMVREAGVTTFKYFMFYKGLNLSADTMDGKALTMSDSYDLGHLYAIMTEAAKADAKYGAKGRIAVSVHCENDELIKHFIRKVKAEGLTGLRAYSEARPSLTERVAVHDASALAASARARLNLLHLSSADALKAAIEVQELYPELDVRREATLHHLCLTYDAAAGSGMGGKVNPPLRSQADIDALWQGVLTGKIDWVASDHACTPASIKGDELWPAASGFGGTSLLYPVMISEGYHKRGLSLGRIAELVATNPAKAHACAPEKGAIAVGADADLAFIDLDKEQVVTAGMLHSAQEYTPFEGYKIKGWPVRTVLRGHTVYLNGEVVGQPGGKYLKRPLAE